MLRMSSTQFSTMGQFAQERYLSRLLRHLQGDDFAAGRARMLPAPESPRNLSELVNKLVSREEQMDIHQEGDMSPFVMLSLPVSEEFRRNPISDWISAILNATTLPAEQRLDAIYSLLPPALRDICFSQI